MEMAIVIEWLVIGAAVDESSGIVWGSICGRKYPGVRPNREEALRILQPQSHCAEAAHGIPADRRFPAARRKDTPNVLGQLFNQEVFLGGQRGTAVGPAALCAIGEDHNE